MSAIGFSPSKTTPNVFSVPTAGIYAIPSSNLSTFDSTNLGQCQALVDASIPFYNWMQNIVPDGSVINFASNAVYGYTFPFFLNQRNRLTFNFNGCAFQCNTVGTDGDTDGSVTPGLGAITVQTAMGSDGFTLPQSTISITNGPGPLNNLVSYINQQGAVNITTSTGIQVVRYTGISVSGINANLTGCVGGSGVMAVGNNVNTSFNRPCWQLDSCSQITFKDNTSNINLYGAFGNTLHGVTYGTSPFGGNNGPLEHQSVFAINGSTDIHIEHIGSLNSCGDWITAQNGGQGASNGIINATSSTANLPSQRIVSLNNTVTGIGRDVYVQDDVIGFRALGDTLNLLADWMIDSEPDDLFYYYQDGVYEDITITNQILGVVSIDPLTSPRFGPLVFKNIQMPNESPVSTTAINFNNEAYCNISTVAVTSNIATIHTTFDHGVTVGANVQIGGLGGSAGVLNGTWKVSSVDPILPNRTFSFNITTSDIPLITYPTSTGVSVSTLQCAAGVATVTMAAPHSYLPGQCIVIAGAGTGLLRFNGFNIITGVTSTTFTFGTSAAVSVPTVAPTSVTGVIVLPITHLADPIGNISFENCTLASHSNPLVIMRGLTGFTITNCNWIQYANEDGPTDYIAFMSNCTNVSITGNTAPLGSRVTPITTVQDLGRNVNCAGIGGGPTVS